VFYSGYELGVIPRPYGRGYSGAPLWGAVSAVCSRVRLYPSRLLYALGLYQTLDDAEVVNQSNRKRCWSTALQKLLLQSFTVEAQRVGRARQSTCPPGWVVRTRLFGAIILAVRALTGAATSIGGSSDNGGIRCNGFRRASSASL